MKRVGSLEREVSCGLAAFLERGARSECAGLGQLENGRRPLGCAYHYTIPTCYYHYSYYVNSSPEPISELCLLPRTIYVTNKSDYIK